MMLMFFKDDLELLPVIISTLVGVGTLAIGRRSSCARPCREGIERGQPARGVHDLGNVLGVAILGSLASIIYRSGLPPASCAQCALTAGPSTPPSSRFPPHRSSPRAGLAQLLQKGIEAFNDSVVITCFVGGVIILVVAVVVRALIPATKITEDDEAPGDGDAPLLETAIRRRPATASVEEGEALARRSDAPSHDGRPVERKRSPVARARNLWAPATPSAVKR
ncbi:MAG: hypothetical protein ACLTMP_08270 [Eggerthella lenta]